jgi:hypothetical protein
MMDSGWKWLRDTTVTAARDTGIAGFIMTPLDRKQLTELVRKILDERKH